MNVRRHEDAGDTTRWAVGVVVLLADVATGGLGPFA